ncbi:MAG TPA: hypothetical protein VFR23_05105 [Jiangellaceae bacterium]|nr:hypothetical protein [Jiangellaceae bacterium]
MTSRPPNRPRWPARPAWPIWRDARSVPQCAQALAEFEAAALSAEASTSAGPAGRARLTVMDGG